MRCECGCGFEGEDTLAQWLLEEALIFLLEQTEAKENEQKLLRLQAAELHKRVMAKQLDRMKQRMGIGRRG